LCKALVLGTSTSFRKRDFPVIVSGGLNITDNATAKKFGRKPQFPDLTCPKRNECRRSSAKQRPAREMLISFVVPISIENVAQMHTGKLAEASTTLR
jgi:hypothetical protein